MPSSICVNDQAGFQGTAYGLISLGCQKHHRIFIWKSLSYKYSFHTSIVLYVSGKKEEDGGRPRWSSKRTFLAMVTHPYHLSNGTKLERLTWLN